MKRKEFLKTLGGATALTLLPLSIFAAENNNGTAPINNNDPDGVGEGYRIPKIGEFVKGSSFEYNGFYIDNKYTDKGYVEVKVSNTYKNHICLFYNIKGSTVIGTYTFKEMANNLKNGRVRTKI